MIQFGAIVDKNGININIFDDSSEKKYSFGLDEVTEVYKIFKIFVGKERIESIHFFGTFCNGRTEKEKIFIFRDEVGILKLFYESLKERFIEEREKLLRESSIFLKDVTVFVSPANSYDATANISDDKTSANFTVSFSDLDFGRDVCFVIDLLDALFSCNERYLSMMENYWFDEENLAKSMESYVIKQGNVTFSFDLYLEGIVLEWLREYEKISGKKVIRVLGGGESFAKPIEDRDYSVMKKINLIRGGKL